MSGTELEGHNYYDNYEKIFHLSLKDMWFYLVWTIIVPEETFVTLREKDAAQFLVLGSATPSNINHVSNIDYYLRPGKTGNDTITIIDQNAYPLAKHVEYLDFPPFIAEFPYPDFQFVQGDIREFPFADSTFDVVISDFTLNFLNTREELNQTFQGIQRILQKNGLCLISVRGDERYPYDENGPDVSENAPVPLEMGRFTIQVFTLQTYMKIAQENGLQLIRYFPSVDDIYAVMKKS